MAIFDDPGVAFDNAFARAQNFVDTQRKNMAFKALEQAYGPIVGDIDLADKAQTYAHNEQMNPLKVENQQQTNAFNAQFNPLRIEGQRLNNETAQFNLDNTKETAADTERLQQAQAIHSALSSVLDTTETELNGVVDPNERLAIFDRQVQQIAPMIGADATELAHSLAQQRAMIAAQGVGAIPVLRQQLESTMNAGLTDKDRLDMQLVEARIATEEAQARKADSDAETARIKAEAEATKEGKEAKVASRALADFDAKQAIVTKYIDDAIEYAKTHPLATGITATLPWAKELPEVKNLAAKLKTIGANIGFAELSRIKSTGATLGPVSNYENELLQSVQGAIEQGQERAQFIATMQELKETLKGSSERMHAAFQEDFGDAAGVVDYTTYFGGGQ